MGEHPAEECLPFLSRDELTMDIFFCDICNESVPQSDLDSGAAVRRGERVMCAVCDKVMTMDAGGSSGSAPAAAQSGAAAEQGGEGSEATAAPAAVPEVGRAATAVAPASARVSLSSCLLGLLSLGFIASLASTAYLWVEGERSRAALSQSLVALEERDEAADVRFRDLQAYLARQEQERDTITRDGFSALEGSMNEKFTNLGSRAARIENSVEALRESTAEDRRSVEASVKSASEAANLASDASGTMQDELGYLKDRVLALEEVLEGGVATGGSGESGGQPSWLPYLPELKDPSAGNRWNAVTVLGDTEDPRVVQYLLPMLEDEDVFVRMATARVLGDLGSAAAIPGLISTLSDSQAAVREAAVVALRVISGKDFRFDPLSKEADRVKAQGAWRKWWEENSEDLLGG